ncbi:transposase [Desulfococcaceae bacterium HSG8]|nr:transposase [Desulfococcaceae bacterium HSG8]
MVTMNNHALNMISKGPKFTRRPDLTPEIRLAIACSALEAQQNGKWGKITELSGHFMISRTFVYMLASFLTAAGMVIFSATPAVAPVTDPLLPFVYMLTLRMEGRCSVEAISAIMKRFDVSFSSVGSVSRYLNCFGSLLPNTLSAETGEIKLAVFLCDELFSKSVPILVTVDPVSSVILKTELANSRKAEDWKEHWECLEDNGICAICLVTDEGQGLTKAYKEALANIVRQPDTYHAIAHVIGKLVKQLENAAYSAILKEQEREDKLDSARSDEVICKRIEAAAEASALADELIYLYDAVHYLYLCIIENLRIFDEDGNLRDRQQAEEEIGEALNMLDELGIPKINKAVKKMRSTLPELLNYFDTAGTAVENLMTLPIHPEALKGILHCQFTLCYRTILQIVTNDLKSRSASVSCFSAFMKDTHDHERAGFFTRP